MFFFYEKFSVQLADMLAINDNIRLHVGFHNPTNYSTLT